MSPALVVMAAGASRRFGRPKQLESVGPSGETLLEYSAFDALGAGCDGVVVVVRPETESLFRQRLDPGLGRRTEITYVHQTLAHPKAPDEVRRRSKPWGTAHAVLAASAAIDGPFVVLNADDFYGAEPLASVLDHLRGKAARTPPVHAVVGFEVGRTLSAAGPVSRALCRIDDRGRLVDIVEIARIWRADGGVRYRGPGGRGGAGGSDRSLSGTELVSMNLWGFAPEIVPLLARRFEEFLAALSSEASQAPVEEELLLPEVVRSAVRSGEISVEVLPSTADWCGLTHAEDLPRVRAAIREHVAAGRYPARLWG